MRYAPNMFLTVKKQMSRLIVSKTALKQTMFYVLNYPFEILQILA
jgi:hypothetical protein